jgi:hypothetical protein
LRLRLVRVWLPIVVGVPGLFFLVAGLVTDDIVWAEGGAFVLGAGASIWLLNFLYRLSVAGERERDEEDEARAYFDRHGRWPDDR